MHSQHTPDTECFEVLYWTAIDAAKLMRKTGSSSGETETAGPPDPETAPAPPEPPAPEPPPPAPAEPCPICTPAKPEVPKSTAQPIGVPRQMRRWKLGAGVGAYWNLAPQAFAAPRFAFGYHASPKLTLEVDVAGQWGMLMNPRNGATVVSVDVGLGALAGCHAHEWLTGCVVLAGGVLMLKGVTPDYRESSTGD